MSIQLCAKCSARDTADGLELVVANIYRCRSCGSRWQRTADAVCRLEKVFVYRCPKCGSTDAFCDESRSVVDISCMSCRECGNENFCDSWQRDREWVAEVELPVGAKNDFDD